MSKRALFLGPAIFALMMVFNNQPWMPNTAWMVAGIGVWMAIWWATEAVPVAATALIPLVLFEPLGLGNFNETAAHFAHPTIYLFLGAFVIAAAIEKTNLHQRIALTILAWTGSEGRRLIFGFMVAAAFLSMWMSNTSTTMMLLPIATSVGGTIVKTIPDLSERDGKRFQTALMLGVAYAATIGGMATLIGTPPNIFLAGFMKETYGIELDFLTWMLLGLPLATGLLPIAWWLLVHRLYPIEIPANETVDAHIDSRRADLGSISADEMKVALVFVVVVLYWMLRRPITTGLGFQPISDSGMAIAGALTLFVLPSSSSRSMKGILTWSDVSNLPWSVLLLFGGGLALAAQVADSGLAEWLGLQLSGTANWGRLTLIISGVVLVIFLTELTSNLATTATFLPIMAALALQLDVSPVLLCIPVTLAASCAFMLPVATPPNAVIYASGQVTIRQMMRAGFSLNLLSTALITLAGLYYVPQLFD
jgi:sodium-dependent dicarboxylate transporter 2/3/5